MACCGRLAPVLLIHVNLLLCVAGGAGLATAARLKWDPSAYVVVRALLPREFRALAAALCTASAALLALAHLAAAALALPACSRRCARALLVTYAVCMAGLACAEAAGGAWLGARLADWLRAEQEDLRELRDHLRPLLALLARYHPLPDHLKDLIEEAETDAPHNLHVAAAAALLTALLQLAAVLLALLSAAALAARTRRAPSLPSDSSSCSITSTDYEKAPLRTAYRGGRLVIL